MEHYKEVHEFYTNYALCDGKMLDNVLRHYVRVCANWSATCLTRGRNIVEKRYDGIISLMDQCKSFETDYVEAKHQLRESIKEIRRLKKLLKENNIKY